MNVQPKREGFVEISPSGNSGGGASPQQAQPQRIMPPPERPPEPEIDAQPPAPPAETWPLRVKLLHKPIRNNSGELVNELVFREPTAGDINRYGNPVRINFDGEVVIDEQKMMRVIAAMSGVLVPMLEAMDPRDWNSCSYRLRSFFLPEVAAW